ncbi:rRNA-processing protein FYV7 [Phalaenopsis equestris]|uniref:rRNA-processing protein FYV7 n=1 Tax=Phalaenopsis equestris TaxID=78828 RepID=UPI0009E21A02|nr:rRNA-processing protein FYV7 [Phalaenopsis equestris]
MKKREEFDQVGNRDGNYKRNRKKNERRIGGKALSLEAFANAKSMPSGYNPSFIKKQREFYRNAKYVSKFKKSIKGESQFDEKRHSLSIIEATNEDESGLKSHKIRKKKKFSLKDLEEEVVKKRIEAEKLRMDREAVLQAKKEERAIAEAKRKLLRDNMSKRTRSGQPVMKYRIQHLLEGLLEKA